MYVLHMYANSIYIVYIVEYIHTHTYSVNTIINISN